VSRPVKTFRSFLPSKPKTLAAQALGRIDFRTGAIVPPIYPAVQYARTEDGNIRDGRSYTRDQNPTYEPVEELLATLENGSSSMLFSSGMAAATTVFETLRVGDHVVAPEEMYWMLRQWLQQLARFGRINLDLVPNADINALREAVRPGVTRIVWVETPANPSGAITDIAATVAVAHDAGAHVVVDNTVATPVLSRPIEHGADLVMHSATKQLNGHSDVLAGALVTARKDQLWEKCRRERAARGAVMGPFESWLLLRGMRTLYLRVYTSAQNAQLVAELLNRHPAVSDVLYPGLKDHPGHSTAVRQMEGGFGPIVSFCLKGGKVAAANVSQSLRLFHNATSLGGVESLVEHRSTVEAADSPVPDNLLRLSIGIEDVDDLVADLNQALEAVIS